MMIPVRNNWDSGNGDGHRIFFMMIWLVDNTKPPSIVNRACDIHPVRNRFLQRLVIVLFGLLLSWIISSVVILSAQFRSYQRRVFVSLTFVTISIHSLARVVAVVWRWTLLITEILCVISCTILTIPMPMTKIAINTSKRVNHLVVVCKKLFFWLMIVVLVWDK